MQGYVNVVVLSKTLMRVLGLLKKHGPSFLVGKFNYPGGHIESGETPAQAAVRELKEEADIDIALDSLILVSHKVFGTEAELYTFCAVSDEVYKATQMTDEPLTLFDVSDALSQALVQPAQFCSDFMSLLVGAVEAYRATQPRS